jgi:uncharacterized protein YlaI
MSHLKLPIALDTKSNELIHISKVTIDNKNDFNFVCPECKSELITKIGKINTPHFAHKNMCSINGETIIHLMAKDILSKNNKISLPIYNPICMEWQSINCDYKYLHSEKSYGDIVPDVVIDINGREVFIEVAHSHFIDDLKKQKLNDLDIETWEINLKNLNLFDYEDFSYDLLFDDMNKKSFVLKLSNYNKLLNRNVKTMFCEDKIYGEFKPYTSDLFSKENKLLKELVNHYQEYRKLNPPVTLKTKHNFIKDNYYRLYDVADGKTYWILLNKDGSFIQVYLIKLINDKIEYDNIAYYHDIFRKNPFENFTIRSEENRYNNLAIMCALRETLGKYILNTRASMTDKKYSYDNYFGERYFLYDVSGINYKQFDKNKI